MISKELYTNLVMTGCNNLLQHLAHFMEAVITANPVISTKGHSITRDIMLNAAGNLILQMTDPTKNNDLTRRNADKFIETLSEFFDRALAEKLKEQTAEKH